MSHDKLVNGFRVVLYRPITQNEMDWIQMLRAICEDAVPGPTLVAVQALRVAMGKEHLAR